MVMLFSAGQPARGRVNELGIMPLQQGSYRVHGWCTQDEDELLYVHDVELLNNRYVCEDVQGATWFIPLRWMILLNPVRIGDFELWRTIQQMKKCVRT